MDDGIQVLDTDIPIIEDTPVVDDTTYTPYERINFENGTLVSPGIVDLETGEFTMPVYSGKAPANAQNLNHLEDGIKNLENYVLNHSGSSGDSGGGDSEPIGTVKAYAGSITPDGYLMCDGSQVSKTDYGELFAVLGTAFNLSSDTDSTKFRLPDLRGRVIVGVGSFDTTHSFTLAKTGGEYEHLLTTAELPRANVIFTQSGNGNFISTYTSSANGPFSADEVGGTAHNNIQPYVALKYIIKAVKTTPLMAGLENNLASNSTEKAPSIYAVNQQFSKISSKVVWTNPSPTASFASQNIVLDLTNAKKIEIIYLSGDNYSIGIAYKDLSTRHDFTGYVGNNNFTCIRNMVFHDGNVFFTDASGYGISSNTSFVNPLNNSLIPQKIIAYYN